MKLDVIDNNIIYNDIIKGLINNKSNPRVNIQQFLKLKDDKDIFYYVLKDCNDRYLSIAAIRKMDDIYYVNEIQSMIPGMSYGKVLINSIIEKYKNVWWMCDPSSSDTLKKYYRSLDNAIEYELKDSIYGNNTSFFYNKDIDDITKNYIIKYIQCIYSKVSPQI